MSDYVHRLRIPILSLCLLALPGTNVHAGNFKNFQSLMQDQGFTYTTTLNGFSVYEKKNVSIMMRSCGGYCCEGLIVAKPMSHEELGVNVTWVYGSLQNTLEWKGRKFVDPKFMSDRVRNLVKQIVTNLEHANRTKFAFDHLNVRGQCDPVSDNDYRDGKRPVLIIKLCIP
jgi:hypothetical protein